MKIGKYRSVKEAVEASKLNLNQEQIVEIDNFQKKLDNLEPSIDFYLIKFDKRETDKETDEPLFAIIDEQTYNTFGIDYLKEGGSNTLLIIYKSKITVDGISLGLSEKGRLNKPDGYIHLLIIDRKTI